MSNVADASGDLLNARQRYVIALKREHWGPVDLYDVLAQLINVGSFQLVGDVNNRRTIVAMEPDVLQQIRDAIGTWCHIEPVIEYHARAQDR